MKIGADAVQDGTESSLTEGNPQRSTIIRGRTNESHRHRRRLRLRSVRIQLSDFEIGALVRLGYLGSPDDMRAIGYAATAFISDALFGT